MSTISTNSKFLDALSNNRLHRKFPNNFKSFSGKRDAFDCDGILRTLINLEIRVYLKINYNVTNTYIH